MFHPLVSQTTHMTPTPSSQDWRDVFCGRERQLSQLSEAYHAVLREGGPRLAVVCAERGMGKTRLVQEFYRYLQTAHDPAHYWPDASAIIGNNLRVAPDFRDPQTRAHFESFSTAERPMPYLWWGFRLNDPEDRNAIRSDMAGHRRTLEPHLERARFAREHAAREAALRTSAKDVALDAAMKIGEAVLDSVPGVGLTKNLVEVGVGVLKTVRSSRDLRNQREQFSQTTLASLDAERAQDLDDRTLEELTGLMETVDEASSLPLIVFCDDAQFARQGGDEGALRFLERLWQRATEGRWAMLLVATHWAVDWEQDRHGAAASFANSFAEAAEESSSNVIGLPKQSDLAALVCQGLPGLPPPDAAIVLRKADGNLQVLIELIGKIRAAPAWRNRQGALTPHGRKQIETHSCNLTTLITERLLSDATPPEVRLTVALSSIQGMQFLCSLTEEAARELEMGPTEAGLQTAEDPLRLVVGVEAGVASFVQRAYRDAAHALIESQLGDPAEIKAGVLQSALAILDDPDRRGALAAPQLQQMLGVMASLGEESEDSDLCLRAGRGLIELIGLAPERAQRASLARRFEQGLDSRWPFGTFDLPDIATVCRALEDWHGPGAATGLRMRLVDRARAAHSADPSDENLHAVASALRGVARALYKQGHDKDALLLLEERVLHLRTLVDREQSADRIDALCDSLREWAEIAPRTPGGEQVALRLWREVVSIRRRQADASHAVAETDALANALVVLVGEAEAEEGIACQSELVSVRKQLATMEDAEQRHFDAASAVHNLACLLAADGQHEEALRRYEDGLSMLRSLMAQQDSTAVRKELSFALEDAAVYRRERGDLPGQRELLLEAVAEMSVAAATADARTHLADLHDQLARNAAATGLWAEALSHCREHEGQLRALGYVDESLLVLRRELGELAPAEAHWPGLDELDGELRRDDEINASKLASLRTTFADRAARTPELCAELTNRLLDEVERSCSSKDWDSAAALSRECAKVEEWTWAQGWNLTRSDAASAHSWLSMQLESCQPARALQYSNETLRLRRQQAALRIDGDAGDLASTLLEACRIATKSGEANLALGYARERLDLVRQAVDQGGDNNLNFELADALERVATCAREASDWPTHDAAQRERSLVGAELWRGHGEWHDLCLAQLSLIQSACRRGALPEAEESAASLAALLRAVREKSGFRSTQCLNELADAVVLLYDSHLNVAGELKASLAEAIDDLAARDLSSSTSFADLQNLAVSLREDRLLAEAEPLQRKALSLAIKKNGTESEDAAGARSALGRLLQLKGDMQGAREEYVLSLDVRERLLGPDAKATCLIRQRLAELGPTDFASPA